MRASVSHLVLHCEPFFFLVVGLRFLKRLKNSEHDPSLTIQLKPRFVIWMYLTVCHDVTAIGSLLAPVRILVLYSGPFFIAHRGLCRINILLFGWVLPGWIMTLSRCPPNLKAVSITHAVLWFCTADCSLWHIRICDE